MTDDKTTPWHSPPEVWSKLRPLAREMRRAATSEEDLVWERLRGRRFHGLRFRRQHAIGSFIVDFYCSENRLVIEVDGGVHETSVEADTVRQQYLEGLGFVVVRLQNHEVKEDLDEALAKVWAVVEKQVSDDSPLRKRRGGGGEVA
jgi:very-short-patch-repair endonuclease